MTTVLGLIIHSCLFLHVFAAESFTCPAGFSCSKIVGRSGGAERDYKITPCTIGTYSHYGEGICKPCDSGYYTVKNESASCNPCPRGHECQYPDRNPRPCPIGTYSSCIAQPDCSPCPNGQYTADVGATHCISCPAGSRCDSNSVVPNIPQNASWSKNGVTVAGGYGSGSGNNKLNYPYAFFVDDDQTIFISDHGNHRIVQWKKGDTTGQVVAGGNGQGSRLDQFNAPMDVLLDNEADSLIICDHGNQRVVRWSRRSGITQGEILIDSITCSGLAMDDQRNLYVSDIGRHEVRRYRIGDRNGTPVAGGNGQGAGINQLDHPRRIFVDRQQTIYVSDNWNHRVMKWSRGATEGVLVSGGQGYGSALTHLYWPNGIIVDSSNAIYIADLFNSRVLRWSHGATQGTVAVGGNGQGSASNQLNFPIDISFDRNGDLYVADYHNHRIQRFSIY